MMVNYDDSVGNAIRLMTENKYSQLPVIEKEKVVGVVSYQSVANTIFNFLENITSGLIIKAPILREE